MNCHDVDKVLDGRWGRPAEAPPPEAAGHLRVCARCRELWNLAETGAAETAAPALPEATRSRIEQAVLGSLEPVRPLPGAGRFVLGFLGAFLLVLLAGLAFVGVRTPRIMSFSQFGGVSAVLLVGALAAAVSLSRQAIPGSRHGMAPARVVTLVVVSLAAVYALLFPWRLGRSFWTWGPLCALFGLLWAIPAAALLYGLLRRTVLLAPDVTGATIGLLAGLASESVVHCGCMNITAPHVTVWHAGVPLTTALVGFLLGARAERRA